MEADGAPFTPPPPPSLSLSLSVLRFHGYLKLQLHGSEKKSKQTLKSPRIYPGTSCSESRTLTNWAMPTPVWFEQRPLGFNTLANMMKNISEAAELSKIYTNQCWLPQSTYVNFKPSKRPIPSTLQLSTTYFTASIAVMCCPGRYGLQALVVQPQLAKCSPQLNWAVVYVKKQSNCAVCLQRSQLT